MSFTALPYSVRFKRCSVACPGLGLARALRSSEVSSQVAKPFRVALSGRGIPCGGMEPVPSLRMTFSSVSACAETLDKSRFSSVNPPVFSFSLWQVTQ